MKKSDFLKKQVADARAVLQMVHGDGWQLFMREVVDVWEAEAFRRFKSTPANQMDEVQAFGKAADAIREWPANFEQQLETAEDALRAIQEGEDDDEDIGDGGMPQPRDKSRLETIRKILKSAYPRHADSR